jgi:hypothetical protein
MRKAILQKVKATFPLLAGCFLSTLCIHSSVAQQNVIANKDNTRPETTRQTSSPAIITSFKAAKFNGYNEISWTALSEQATRKFIVEYSADDINFSSAGQVLSTDGKYILKHYTQDTRPLVYRVKIEELTGKFSYSPEIVLDGTEVPPVKIYPTIVTGNMINANAGLPVERLTITSADGQQQFAKDLNGVRDFIPIAIPALGKGIYFITFYGNGWKSTSRFLIS